MKVFITGVNGFVGRELVRQCKMNDIHVVGVDTTAPSAPMDEYHQEDINDPGIADLIPENCDAVIHLAALSRDQDCRDKAYDCFRVNVLGTINLMEAAQKRQAQRFIFASSEWVYDSFTNDEVKNEATPINIMNHKSEYALSKLVSEANLRQKYQHGFCHTVIFRFGIVYGPRPGNWSAVEALFNQVRTQSEVTVGSLDTGRCFIHVTDLAAGIIKGIGLEGFQLINLQGEKLITLRDIIETSKKVLGRNPSVVEKDPANASIRCVSNDYAKRTLKWEPAIDLEAGLHSLIINE